MKQDVRQLLFADSLTVHLDRATPNNATAQLTGSAASSKLIVKPGAQFTGAGQVVAQNGVDLQAPLILNNGAKVVTRGAIERLIKAGAFDNLNHPRRGLLMVFEQIIDTTVGTGASPKPGQICVMHYTGWLYEDGKKGDRKSVV